MRMDRNVKIQKEDLSIVVFIKVGKGRRKHLIKGVVTTEKERIC